MRRRGRVDANQLEIVKALRLVGATVQPLSDIGNGCSDLLVGFRKANYCLEVKDPTQKPKDRKLTDDQRAWHAAWCGQVCVVETIEEAFKAIGA